MNFYEFNSMWTKLTLNNLVACVLNLFSHITVPIVVDLNFVTFDSQIFFVKILATCPSSLDLKIHRSKNFKRTTQTYHWSTLIGKGPRILPFQKSGFKKISWEPIVPWILGEQSWLNNNNNIIILIFDDLWVSHRVVYPNWHKGCCKVGIWCSKVHIQYLY